MRENRNTVMGWIGLSEGGLVDHPRDPGGRTNKGITQRVYDGWRRKNGMDQQPVDYITEAEARTILFDQYFAPVWFNELPSGVDYAVVDYAVNSGPYRAVKDLQRTLLHMGHVVSVDGHMGFETLNAIRDVEDLGKLVIKLCERRLAFMQSLRTWDAFGKGWTRRVMGEVTGAQDDDTGVIDRGYRMAQGYVARPDVTVKPAPERARDLDQYRGVSALFAAIAAFISGLFLKRRLS